MSEKESKLKLQRLVNSRLELFEQRVNEGWTYKMLVDDLAEEGVEIREKYFGRCMNIARKKKAGVVAPRVSPSPPTPKPPKVVVVKKLAPKSGDGKRFNLKQLDEDELF